MCGGFAAYSGIDANIVRLVMIVLAVLGGSGVVLYLVAWAIVLVEDAAEATDNGRHTSLRGLKTVSGPGEDDRIADPD